jgi:16S rRNA (cytosine1402-N4)-methyltransferase
MKKSVHEPVLLKEIIGNFTSQVSNVDVGSKSVIYVDGTLGGAGHAKAIASAFGKKITIIGIDNDPTAIDRAKSELSDKATKVIIEKGNFRDIDKILIKNGYEFVDMILLDLGISSDELEESGRGFSFQKDEPLYMTMGDPKDHPFTAETIINEWKEEDIANVIFAYGEETAARRIARSIVNYRSKKRIESTLELAEIIKGSVGMIYRRSRIHPATKTFQALRIAVNDELNALKEGLNKAFEHLNKNGILQVISFHSLEDRIVKQYFKDFEEIGGKIITKKPITPTEEEIRNNPRSRSAKLRVIKK